MANAWKDYGKKPKCPHAPRHKGNEYCSVRDGVPIVPEAATYGLVLMGLSVGLVALARWKQRRMEDDKC